MAKKKNVYARAGYERIAAELEATVEWLESLDIDNLSDDIDWKINQKGGVSPQVVSKIEEKLKTTVKTIKEAAGMLQIILEKEGITPAITGQIDVLNSTLDQIQQYYTDRPITLLNHRRASYQSGGGGTAKNGTPKPTRTLTFIVATQNQQIADRTWIMKSILETFPLLEKLQDTVEALDVKGDYEIPESLLARGIN